MKSPYFIEGPALISFSGGRTSAYMLHQILHAHDGELPSDVVVTFANTGKEREETLRFVYECGIRWNCNIHWLEWRAVIGLRYDEGMRVLKAIDRSESGKDPWRNHMPLSRAKVVKSDILSFWLGENSDPTSLDGPLPQGFDLGLKDYEGNCDLCFLKGPAKIKRLIRDNPSMVEWWKGMEASTMAKSQAAGEVQEGIFIFGYGKRGSEFPSLAWH